MSFLSERQLSTDKLVFNLCTFSLKLFPVQTGNQIKLIPAQRGKGIKINFQPKQEMESKLIRAQTGNGTIKMYTYCEINLSEDSWPPKRTDIQLLSIKSCMPLVFGGQLSTDKKGLGLVYIFIVPFPVWAGNNFDSSPYRKWNYENVYKL